MKKEIYESFTEWLRHETSPLRGNRAAFEAGWEEGVSWQEGKTIIDANGFIQTGILSPIQLMELYYQEKITSEMILDKLYTAYGSDSGILFGITSRIIVQTIVEFTINTIKVKIQQSYTHKENNELYEKKG